MSGSGTKFLASTLLALNLMPGPDAVASPSSEANSPQTSRFVGTGLGQAGQQPGASANPPAGNAAPVDPSAWNGPGSEQDPIFQLIQRRQNINQALIEAAQDDFAHLAKLSQDGYSKDLNRKEKQLSKYLEKHHPDRPQAVYLDPNKFDAGIALGFTPEGTTERLLGFRRVDVSNEQLGNIVRHMQADDPSRVAAPNSFTQDPSAHYDFYEKNPQACVIVPESGYAAEVAIKGFSYQENLDYSNLHEGWHCKNDTMVFDDIPKEAFDTLDTGNPQHSIGNKDQMEIFSRLNRGESMSDVGALGDMIRKGHSIDIIDKVQQDRYNRPEDYTHWTAQSLEGLKQKIRAMGIDTFRSLSDKDAKALYEDVVAKNTFTPGVAEVIFSYRRNSSDEDRAALRDWQESFTILDSMKAAGAAVHDGADMKTLDDRIAASANDGEKKALTGLRDQINQIGVDNFRKLEAEDALKMSKALHDSGATPTDIGEVAAGYWISTPEQRKAQDQNAAEFKENVPKALAMMKPYGEPPDDAQKAAMANHVRVPPPLTPEEGKILQQAGQWNAAQLLQDKAFAKDGKITPGTLIHAYGRMQDELRQELKKHPEDPLLRAKTTKLQQSFISTVQNLDYVQANAEHGVDIVAQEPSLSKFREEGKEAAPSAQPKPDQPPAPSKTPAPRRAPAPMV